MAFSRCVRDSVNASMGDGVGRLYSERELFDVTVTVGDEDFRCHKVVLAAVSKFFQANFRNEPASNQVIIDKEYVSTGAFRLFVDMLYGKTDDITDKESADDALVAAMFLQAQFFQEHCERFLVDTMKPDTCLDLWQFADLYDLNVLAEGALKMATSQFEEVAQSAAFPGLPVPFLLRILSSESLVIAKEDNLCRHILCWVEENVQEKERYLPQLLPFVNFTNLSDIYVETLQLSHVNSYLNDALVFKTETSLKFNSIRRTEILARQEMRTPADEMDKVVVAFEGATSIDGGNLMVMKLDRGQLEIGRLTSLPLNNLGTGFATCVWRNELYISGGTMNPRQLKVYNSGTNKWKSLPDLPQERKGHAMAAVNWKVYILGGQDLGIDKNCEDSGKEMDQNQVQAASTRDKATDSDISDGDCSSEESTSGRVLSDISIYNTKTRSWSEFAQLSEPRTDVTAAVLGHRIYVCGGKDADDNPTPLVDCVDTLTGVVYRAGRLPSPGSGARVLSDGGAIFIVLPEMGLYRMVQNYSLIERTEGRQRKRKYCELSQSSEYAKRERKRLKPTLFTYEDQERIDSAFRQSWSLVHDENQTENGQRVTRDNEAGETPPAKPCNATARRNEGMHEAIADSVSEDEVASSGSPVSTVSFRKMAAITGRRDLGACLYKGEVLVCGGLDEKGEETEVVTRFPTHGEVRPRDATLASGSLSSLCEYHTLNIAKDKDEATFRFSFRPEALKNGRSVISHSVCLRGSEWSILVEGSISALFTVRRSATGNKTLQVLAKIWALPASHTASLKEAFDERNLTFYPQQLDSRSFGSSFVFPLNILDPESGFVTETGQVTLEVSLRIL